MGWTCSKYEWWMELEWERSRDINSGSKYILNSRWRFKKVKFCWKNIWTIMTARRRRKHFISLISLCGSDKDPLWSLISSSTMFFLFFAMVILLQDLYNLTLSSICVLQKYLWTNSILTFLAKIKRTSGCYRNIYEPTHQEGHNIWGAYFTSRRSKPGSRTKVCVTMLNNCHFFLWSYSAKIMSNCQCKSK